MNLKKEFQIPTKICLEAKQYMKHLLSQLSEHGIAITGLDYGGLTLMAWTYHHWIKATDTIEAEGYIVQEENARGTTITKVHPAVKIQYDCNAQLRALLVEYGLTPKSRGRMDGRQGMIPFPLSDENPLRKFKIVQ